MTNSSNNNTYNIVTPNIVEQFKQFYTDLTAVPLENIDQLYDPNVIFIDPVHEIQGVANLHAYFSHLCGNLQQCKFEFLDELVGDDSAYIKWNMHFRHDRLNGNKPVTVRGMSHIQFNGKVSYHEDSYDLGQMIYQHLPLLGSAVGFVNKRLAA